MLSGMTWVDMTAVLVIALAAWSGWRAGGLHTLVALVGRAAGLIGGLVLARWISTVPVTFPVRVVGEIVAVLIGLAVGARIARRIAPIHRTGDRPVAPADRVLGLVTRAAVATVAAALVVEGLLLWGSGPVRGAAAASRLPAAVSGAMSGMAPDGMLELRSLVGSLRRALPADLATALSYCCPGGRRVMTRPSHGSRIGPIDADAPDPLAVVTSASWR